MAIDEPAQALTRRGPFETSELLARLIVAYRTSVLRDKLRQRNAELEQLAMTAPITGLPNRRWMQEHLAAQTALSSRHGRSLSALMIDLDHFKTINDRLGHLAGDAVLHEIAARMQARTRSYDALGRWGGDEFLAILPETSASGAFTLAEQLLAIASEPISLPDYPPTHVTISIGVAEWAHTNPARLIRKADEALYEAKQAGRNTLHVAPPTNEPHDAALPRHAPEAPA